MYQYRFIIIAILFVFCNKAFAQQEMGLSTMNIWQSAKTNPAFISDHKFTVGLPNIHLNYYNTGGNFNQFVVDYLNEENTIKVGDAINDLSDEGNILRGVSEIETLSFGYRLGKNIQLGFSHSQKTDVFMDFPKTMAKLFFEGNGQYVGETIQLDNNIQLVAYNEFALSGAMRFSKLTAGVKLKALTGIANASSSNNKLSLFTDSDVYQLTLQSDYQLDVSTFGTVDDLSNFNVGVGKYNVEEIITKNAGVAVDLGITFQVNDKLKIGASVLDLGQIKWTENVNNYSSTGSETYDGFDFGQFNNNDSISFSSAIDTLENAFNFIETSEDFSTTLPLKIYLTGTYQFNKMLRFGGMIYNENYRGQNFSVFAVSANAKLTKLLSVGAIYSGRTDSFVNLGLNFAVKLGPAQLFATTDNILAVVKPYESSNVNLRTGLNLLF